MTSCLSRGLCVCLWWWLRRLCCWRSRFGYVDEKETQQVSPPPDASCSGGTTGQGHCLNREGVYAWHARFHLRLAPKACKAVVGIRIRYTVDTSDAFVVENLNLDSIRDLIYARWDDQFVICASDPCCPCGYRIRLELEFVDETYTGFVHQDVRFQSDTDHIRAWSVAGTNVPHEFGHMLGPPDEYCTVTGTNWCAPNQGGAVWCAPNQGGTIMNTNASNPVPHHFDLIRRKAEELLGCPCQVVAVTNPWPSVPTP